MLTIYPNLKSIIGRIILILIFAIVLYLVITNLITKGDTNGMMILYLLCAFVVILIGNITLSLLGIIKVEINETSGQLEFIRFFSSKTVSHSDITAYYTSVYNTKHGTNYGRIIKGKDNKIIELNPGNLKDIINVDSVLKNPSITYLGEKRSFYPFTSGL